MASIVPKLVPRTRPLPARKTVLLQQTQHLLQSSPVVLFLRPGDFSAEEWRTLRAAISAVPSPSSEAPEGAATAQAKLTVLRPGLLPAILRSPSLRASLPQTHLSSKTHLSGPLAVLTLPSLHPPTLTAVLKIINTFSQSPSRNAPPPDPKAVSKNQPPPPPIERLELLSSIAQDRAFDNEGTKQVGNLPTLDVLRGMLVGLLAMPSSRLVGVLGATGWNLGRTVEGYKLGLEHAGQASAAGTGARDAAKMADKQ
ncbi:hypothetical protein T439DRAFT_320664 [Meredithblackwellia eburnea MCA 4105]